MKKFAEVVGLEATSAFQQLLEDFLLRGCGVGRLGVRGEIGPSSLPSLIGFMLANSVLLQSKYLLPSVFDFTATAASVYTVRPGGCEELMVANLTQGLQSLRAIVADSGGEDVPLAAFSRKLKMKRSKKVDAIRLSLAKRPNLTPPSRHDEKDECLLRR